MKQMAIQMN